MLEISPKNFIDSKGERKILSIARDITERKITEQKTKESEQKYRDIAELLPDVIFETDLNLKLIYVNTIAFEKFGYTKEDLRAGLKITQIVDPEYLEEASKYIKLLI